LLTQLINDEKSSINIYASEVPYLSGKRRVDILEIGSNTLHAYEIKGDNDSLARIKEQTVDYLDTFDYTSVVITQKYLSSIRSIIPKSVGIILFDTDNKNIKNLRKATKRKRLKKKNLLHFLWRNDLLKLINVYNKSKVPNQETHILRWQAEKILSTNNIKIYAIDILKKRYGNKYINFLSEKGSIVSEDDIINLTMSDAELNQIGDAI
ncbi:MAG: hypothetical protein K0R98_577, partial [Rickettsiaceae bacterium]|nr:hypothetical protein [Rickettsiaceae bacterium]